MSDEEQAFIDNIIANRYAVVPRLVYRDWLEERGDTERAKIQSEIVYMMVHGECYKFYDTRDGMWCGDAAIVIKLNKRGDYAYVDKGGYYKGPYNGEYQWKYVSEQNKFWIKVDIDSTGYSG
jgi:uncharacterized protein (TIGR02996 family)